MTLMLILGGVAVGYGLLLLFRCATYALPLFVGLAAAFYLRDHGSGWMTILAAGLLSWPVSSHGPIAASLSFLPSSPSMPVGAIWCCRGRASREPSCTPRRQLPLDIAACLPRRRGIPPPGRTIAASPNAPSVGGPLR